MVAQPFESGFVESHCDFDENDSIPHVIHCVAEAVEKRRDVDGRAPTVQPGRARDDNEIALTEVIVERSDRLVQDGDGDRWSAPGLEERAASLRRDFGRDDD